MNRYDGSRFTDTPCGRCLADAEACLGPLTDGQMADLLLDNFMEIADSSEAHEIARGCIYKENA